MSATFAPGAGMVCCSRSGVAQVFAPAGSDVVCFEPMTARANALAGGAFELAPCAATFSVRVA